MAKKQQSYSAKDFRDPLLQVLGELTQGTGFQPVNCKDTYPLVCSRMGISADEFGVQESSGKLWVHQWIGWAFRALKKSGETTAMDAMGVRYRRGYWALTSAGAAKTNGGATSSTLTVSPMPEESAAAAPDDSYPDAYLRELAIRQTPCYGRFSRLVDACTACLLRVPCSRHHLAQLSALSAEINKRIIRLKTRPAPTATPPPPAPAPSTDAPPLPRVAKTRRRTTTSAFDTRCNRCGDAISTGDQMVWVQTTGRGDGGTYHVECAPEEE